MARLIQQISQAGVLRYDEQVVAEAGLGDLVEEYWTPLRSSRTKDDTHVFLAKLGMARSDRRGTLRPTVAGILLASRGPREWFPDAFIQAVHYHGTDILPGDGGGPYQLDAADITGPLHVQVADACRFVARNMRIMAYKKMGRRDVPQFDMTAVFEALVNAVAHRDYSIRGSKIRLRMFADRLEIYSPGALPSGMTIESLPLLQAARYDVITSLLAKCPVPETIPWLATDCATLMDKRGEGVRIIYEHSQRLSGRTPRHELLGDREVRLTIYGRLPRGPGARSLG